MAKRKRPRQPRLFRLCPFCEGIQPPGGGMLCEGCYDDLLERAVEVMRTNT